MNSALEEQLAQTAAKTLEDLTFFFATPERWEATDISGDDYILGAAFNGDFEGYLVFICPPLAGREMTANMLGMDDAESVSSDQVQDALKEVINIICGNILPAVAGAKAMFNISPPEILDSGQEPEFGRNAPPVGRAKLDLEGEPGYLFLFVDDPEAMNLS